MEKLRLSLMMKLFHVSNRNLQDLLIFHYDPYQILFSQEDGWDLQEKALKETRRELEEEEEKMHVQLLHNKGLGRESLGGYSLGTFNPSSSYIYIAFSHLLLVYY